ncbi:thioesterase II family protein [Acanthopleuribacter pedis]|uniref:Thioesterase n=1 Tax=Acanthopleuribacter pedis TaxID=442870 RepID=A0A8J7PYZ0_9BACT|nr:alpha/beta fold hydrolase [Acanthopleuribacter pedis]MBO1317242.1 thioesterase [Acanthopleuribacter pedis]MBO1318548.1 thioesterase [Acanthopleuribacter pedis]
MNQPMTLLAFPFAGGNRFSYREIIDQLPGDIHVHAFDYPGHGSRFKERPLDDLAAVTDDALAQVQAYLKPPYALFGHSMGAQVAFLLMHRILALGLPAPRKLIVTGRKAPEHWHREEHIHGLSKDAFFAKVEALGGLPPAFLANPELRDLFEPILRADFKAIELFPTNRGPYPVNLPIISITGTEEAMTDDEIQHWQHETTKPLVVHRIEGGHFFLFKQRAPFCQLLADLLR